MARWNHSEPFPNSVVKRCCGDDSCRVADRQNSSMPGFYYTKPKPPTTLGGFAFGSIPIFEPTFRTLTVTNEFLLKIIYIQRVKKHFIY